MEVIFLGPNGNNNQLCGNREATANSRYPPNKYSSCKTLQRKLELKVERAKRNYSQQNGGEVAQVRNKTIQSLTDSHIRNRMINGYDLICVLHKGYKK